MVGSTARFVEYCALSSAMELPVFHYDNMTYIGKAGPLSSSTATLIALQQISGVTGVVFRNADSRERFVRVSRDISNSVLPSHSNHNINACGHTNSTLGSDD